MDTVLPLLGAGLLEAMQPVNLLMIFLGCAIGLLIGAMPGLGSVNGVGDPAADHVPRAADRRDHLPGGHLLRCDVRWRHQLHHPRHSGRFDRGRDRVRRPAARAGGQGGQGADRGRRWPRSSAARSPSSCSRCSRLRWPSSRSSSGRPRSSRSWCSHSRPSSGSGGDDIPKTVFSILIGLVLAAVGLDIISGKPRLIFGDISGFPARHQLPRARHRDLRHRGDAVDAGADPGQGHGAQGQDVVRQAVPEPGGREALHRHDLARLGGRVLPSGRCRRRGPRRPP